MPLEYQDRISLYGERNLPWLWRRRTRHRQLILVFLFLFLNFHPNWIRLFCRQLTIVDRHFLPGLDSVLHGDVYRAYDILHWLWSMFKSNPSQKTFASTTSATTISFFFVATLSCMDRAYVHFFLPIRILPLRFVRLVEK